MSGLSPRTAGRGWHHPRHLDSPAPFSRSPPRLASTHLDADGRLEGFTWGTDFFTYRIIQTAPNNGWTDWATISRDVNVFKASLLLAEQNQDTRLEIFTRGGGDSIWHIRQLG